MGELEAFKRSSRWLSKCKIYVKMQDCWQIQDGYRSPGSLANLELSLTFEFCKDMTDKSYFSAENQLTDRQSDA